jgi:hypothetical protein
MVGGSRKLDEYRIEGDLERDRKSGSLEKYRAWGRRKRIGGVLANADRAVNRSLLVALSRIVPDGTDVGTVGANVVNGSKSGGAQCGKQEAGKNDIQDKCIGGNPCRTYANDSFARCVFHGRSPSLINTGWTGVIVANLE